MSQERLFEPPTEQGGCGWCGGHLVWRGPTVGYQCPSCSAEIAAHRSYREAVEWMRRKAREFEAKWGRR